LVARGHQVTLLSGGWDGAKELEYINGIKVIRRGKNLGPHLILPLIFIKNDYDVIINDLGHAIPWISSVIFKKHNIAFFHHLHARSLPGQVNLILAKIITSIEKSYFVIYHGAVFVTESSTSRNDLQNLSIKDKNIVIIPPGVDKQLFRPGIKTKYPTIIYFGGMRKYKRPQECLYMLKALLANRNDIIL
jgi:glycosyltransferase involved in cell wall biosynthesis